MSKSRYYIEEDQHNNGLLFPSGYMLSDCVNELQGQQEQCQMVFDHSDIMKYDLPRTNPDELKPAESKHDIQEGSDWGYRVYQ